jgi:hypothetical protein
MKFKVGDRVKIKDGIEEVHPKLYGQKGVIVEVDGDWSHPYEVKYDDESLRAEVEGGWIQDLFCDTDLELIEQPRVKELPTTSKLIYIHDLNGSGGNHKNVSVIDLETGVNRLNMRTNEIEDMISHITSYKPTQIIFDIHDRQFRWLLEKYIEKTDLGFKIKPSGEVVYE